MDSQDIYAIKIMNEEGTALINIDKYESTEIRQAWNYIQPNDVVLELGARIGAVSCTIARKLKNQRNLVAVEPDPRAHTALMNNRDRNNQNFQVYGGFISKIPLGLLEKSIWTYSVPDPSSTLPRCSLEQLQVETGCTFNVLIADCEGFLQQFYEENPWFFNQIHTIMFEKDGPKRTNYITFEENLKKHGFRPILTGFHSIWKRLE